MSGIKQQDKAITLLINNTENNNTNENFIYLALESTLPTLQDKQLKYRANYLFWRIFPHLELVRAHVSFKWVLSCHKEEEASGPDCDPLTYIG